MKSGTLFIVAILAAVGVASGQVAVTDPQRATGRLGPEDLLFRDDSAAMTSTAAIRSSKLIAELPITIHVVTREEIERNHHSTLSDVIKSLPGIRVSQPGTGELGETFQLRGLTGNLYTMILINGMPVKPRVVRGMPIQAQLPVRQAERIEVIYGPAAAVYGADAVSGVINIITREPERGSFSMADMGLGENSYRNFSFMAGGIAGRNRNLLYYTIYGGLTSQRSFNLTDGYEEVYNPLHYLQERGRTFEISGRNYEPLQITDASFDGIAADRDSFIERNYPVSYEGSLTLPELEEFPTESNLLGVTLRFRGLELSFNNMYRRSHSSLGQSTYLFKYNNPQNYWGENITSTTLSYARQWTPYFASTTNISSLIYSMDNNSSTALNMAGHTEKLYRYSAGNDLLLEQLFTVISRRIDSLEILSGVTYLNSANLPQTNFLDSPFNRGKYGMLGRGARFEDPVAGSFGINPVSYNNIALFSQAFYPVGRLRFLGGIRFDNNSKYGFSYSPRIASLFALNDRTSVRASIGYAYKAPPASLAYQSLAVKGGRDLDSLTYLAIPNPDLEPENYMSAEFGVIRDITRRPAAGSRSTTLNLSLFYNELRNHIIEREADPGRIELPAPILEHGEVPTITRVNEKSAVSRLYGAQATFLFNNLVSTINLDAELSLTFATSSETFPDLIEIAGNTLSDFTLMPNHFGQLRLSMQPAREQLPGLRLNIVSIWETNWLRVIIPFEEIYNELFRSVDGFYSMDASVSYSVSRNLVSYVKVTNLFDERYGGPVYSEINTPLPYSPQAGRTISVGLSYRIN